RPRARGARGVEGGGRRATVGRRGAVVRRHVRTPRRARSSLCASPHRRRQRRSRTRDRSTQRPRSDLSAVHLRDPALACCRATRARTFRRGGPIFSESAGGRRPPAGRQRLAESTTTNRCTRDRGGGQAVVHWQKSISRGRVARRTRRGVDSLGKRLPSRGRLRLDRDQSADVAGCTPRAYPTGANFEASSHQSGALPTPRSAVARGRPPISARRREGVAHGTWRTTVARRHQTALGLGVLYVATRLSEGGCSIRGVRAHRFESGRVGSVLFGSRLVASSPRSIGDRSLRSAHPQVSVFQIY